MPGNSNSNNFNFGLQCWASSRRSFLPLRTFLTHTSRQVVWPLLSARKRPLRNKALMDMWFVRRLLKRRPSTILVSEIRDSRVFRTWNQDVSIELAHRVLSYGGVEVRFEWKGVKGKEAEGRKRAIELPVGSV